MFTLYIRWHKYILRDKYVDIKIDIYRDTHIHIHTYLNRCIKTHTLVMSLVLYRGAEALVQQAREWETSGEYVRAVECYVKVTNKVTSDTHILEKCWVKVLYSYGCFLISIIFSQPCFAYMTAFLITPLHCSSSKAGKNDYAKKVLLIKHM